MTDADRTALDVLEDCTDAEECIALAGYLRGDLPVESLSYEDVFYPLRHHHEDIAIVDRDVPNRRWFKWGSGDFIYGILESPPPYDPDPSRVNPFPLYEQLLEHGFDVVLLEDAPFTEADDA